MKSVYIICSGTNNHILRVCTSKTYATLYVDMYAAAVNFDMDINRADCPPRDFDGALMRYGWADRVWWQREVLYD